MINVIKIRDITSGYIREKLYVMWIIIIRSSRQIQVREWHRESCEIVCLNIDEPLAHVLVNLVKVYTYFNGAGEGHIHINSASC